MTRLLVVCVLLGLLCVITKVSGQVCPNACAATFVPCTHDGECCKGSNINCPGAKAICFHADHDNPTQCGGRCQCTNGCRENADCNDDPSIAGCTDPHCVDAQCSCGHPV